MASRVSLAELAAAGFVLHAAEAAAIVVEICRQYSRGSVRGIPSAHVIRLTPDGGVVAEGPITTNQPPIARAAQLLNDLLPAFEAPPTYRVPGALRLIVARALGTLDLPRFASLDEFSNAVERFAAADLAAAARNLYRSWECSRAPRELTISDVRRARRATGLTLDQISSVCGVRTDLLRELEWGYLRNWRNEAASRSWLSGYAKASGLDEQLLTSIVEPMLQDVSAPEPESDETPFVAAGARALVTAASPSPRGRWHTLWALAAAAVIALVAAIGTTVWPRPQVQARFDPPAPAFVPPFFDVSTPLADAERSKAYDAPTVPVRTRPVRAPHVAKSRPTVKHASVPARKPPTKPNFFKRTLLRIVIK